MKINMMKLDSDKMKNLELVNKLLSIYDNGNTIITELLNKTVGGYEKEKRGKEKIVFKYYDNILEVFEYSVILYNPDMKMEIILDIEDINNFNKAYSKLNLSKETN